MSARFGALLQWRLYRQHTQVELCLKLVDIVLAADDPSVRQCFVFASDLYLEQVISVEV